MKVTLKNLFQVLEDIVMFCFYNMGKFDDDTFIINPKNIVNKHWNINKIKHICL